MVWHAFTEFLLLLLPALSSRAFRRSYNQLNLRLRNFRWSSILPSTSPLSSEKTVVQRGHFSSLPSDQCAICAEDSSFNISSPADASETLSTYLNSVAYASVADGSLKRDDIDSSPVVSEVDEPPPHPITTPYAASCGHIYCYVCLSGRLIRALDDGDEGWVCLRCAEIVRSSERVHALCEDDSTRTSEGLASDVDELASFESDMSFDSESEQPCD
ncbi:hypothetical protein EW145_g639 [Phellinidium pouzarii]|uniref:RING-type domain-containing protein n=1 Tax=Phellinidium pouzarii TaxID=167371 RepID=A0A4S4LJF3_9AGAM|nr:hypothetical protein EW145_g639 [Phellinidium pouzarii]